MSKRRSQKSVKNLVELLESAAVSSIKQLSTIAEYAFISPLLNGPSNPDLATSDQEQRDALLNALKAQPRESLKRADQDAIRLLQMMGFRIDQLLARAVERLEFEGHIDLEQFDAAADALTRLIWLRAKAPIIFEQIEALYLTHHFHGHKNFRGFTVNDGKGREFVWTEEIGDRLQTAIGHALDLSDDAISQCELIHFEMESDDGEQASVQHYLIVYHPGSIQRLRRIVDRKRDLFHFIPALEATLVYDPQENKVHVLSRNKHTAKKLADQFALIGFEEPLSKEPVDAAHYELSMFKSPFDLIAGRATGALIEDGWVASLTVALGHTSHKLTFNLNHSDNVWDIIQESFGSHNPLAVTRAVREVKLSFVIRFDDETESRALDITVGDGGQCSLLTIPNPRLRRCAHEILSSLGIMAVVTAAEVGTDMALLRRELALLETAEDTVDGYHLTSLGLDASDLIKKGLLTRKTPGQYITVSVEDDEGQQGFRRLQVRSNSTCSYAFDEVSDQRYDLSEGDLARYAMDKSYLLERLSKLLNPHLVDRPTQYDDHYPWFLGYYDIAGQKVPVALVSRLFDAKHANKLDSELRRSNLGLSIVLSTTLNSDRYYLGHGIVIPVESVLQVTAEGIEVDLSPVAAQIQQRQRIGASTNAPTLRKKDSRNALLCGPWPQPWTLTRKDWIDVVEVLVDVWNSGQRKCPKDYIERTAGDIAIRSFGEFFRGAPEWKTYIRGADGESRSRNWELAIGLPTYAEPEAIENEVTVV